MAPWWAPLDARRAAPSRTHTPEALERLVESYLSLGIPAEAQKAAAVLGRNYPGTKWYERSYKLMQEHGGAA